jgi:hypothetical protein
VTSIDVFDFPQTEFEDPQDEIDNATLLVGAN